jgi:hypothetical protein
MVHQLTQHEHFPGSHVQSGHPQFGFPQPPVDFRSQYCVRGGVMVGLRCVPIVLSLVGIIDLKSDEFASR